jgi:hypothetical protein
MLVTNAKGYDDLRITAFAPRTSAPVQANFSAAPAGYEIQSWQFANNNTERGLNGVTQTPHSWARCGTDINMHVHMSTTGALAEGVVVGFFVSLFVQKMWTSLAEAYNPANPYWCFHTVPAGGYGAGTHIMTTDIAIPATYFGTSSMMMLYVFRKKTSAITTVNAGEVTENVDDVFWLHEVDFHVQTVNNGTRTPAV